jgi:hypothetical protein
MKWVNEEIDKCILLLKSGKTYGEISEITNRSNSSIRNMLNKKSLKYNDYKIDKENLKCLYCGTEFISLISDKRIFCSKSCSASYNNKNKVKKQKNTSTCLNCGNEILENRKYCNNKCQVEHRQKIAHEKIKNGDTSLYETQYKKYLIAEHGNMCMKCGWCEINPITGKVPIQLEHIDGNSDNNSLDNLELLCPNCHSLTPTFGALNKGNVLTKRKISRYNSTTKKL